MDGWRYVPTNSRATTACVVNLGAKASQFLPVDKKVNYIGIHIVHPSIICYPLIGLADVAGAYTKGHQVKDRNTPGQVTSPAQDTYSLRIRGPLECLVSLMFYWTMGENLNPERLKPRTFLPIDD